MQGLGYFFVVGFILITILFSFVKKNDTYSSFIKGAKDAIKSGIGLLPYIMVMYVATNVFLNSMLVDDLVKLEGLPNNLLLQGIIRPISNHSSLSIMIESLKKYGVDSNVGIVSSILQGGGDTTIYVMGLYFGYAGIKKSRHAYFVGIFCDIITLLLSICIFFLLK